MHSQTVPNFIAVDIRDVLRDYAMYRNLPPVYKYFPLKDIVECVLSVRAYDDMGERFWYELENRLSEVGLEDHIDYDYMALFHELLCCYLDEYIRSQIPRYIESTDYVFHRWIGTTSVILQRDQNAASSHSPM